MNTGWRAPKPRPEPGGQQQQQQQRAPGPRRDETMRTRGTTTRGTRWAPPTTQGTRREQRPGDKTTKARGRGDEETTKTGDCEDRRPRDPGPPAPRSEDNRNEMTGEETEKPGEGNETMGEGNETTGEGERHDGGTRTTRPGMATMTWQASPAPAPDDDAHRDEATHHCCEPLLTGWMGVF